MSQGDIEKRTGLLRCYLSRVENGHTVPAIDTLEKMAQALGLPMYRLFINDAAVHKPNIPSQKNPSRAVNKEHARYLRALTKLFSRISEKNRVLLLHMASKMANSAWQRCRCSFVLCDRSSPELRFPVASANSRRTKPRYGLSPDPCFGADAADEFLFALDGAPFQICRVFQGESSV